MLKRVPGEQLATQDDGVLVDLNGVRRRINPLSAIRSRLSMKSKTHELSTDRETVAELTRQVTRKLVEGIAENGMVSLFHDKVTGELVTELYTGFFTSPELPGLQIDLWRHHREPVNSEFHERIYGIKDERVSVSAYEELVGARGKGGRAITIANRWGTPEDTYDLVYRRNATEEATNTAIPRSDAEKAEFLRQILATEFDGAAMANKFGAPYEPGATWSNNNPSLNSPNVHNAYWVRDIRDQLPALSPGSPELVSPQ